MLSMLFMMSSEFNTADIGVECNVVDVVFYVMMWMLCWNVILLMIV